MHLTPFSLDVPGIFDGDPIDSSKTYGQKSALTTFTCTQHFEDGPAFSDAKVAVSLVPPK